MQFIIYRDSNNKIYKYSKVNYSGDDLENRIKEFNLKGPSKAEVVTSDDFKALIELAEKNRELRLYDIKSIEDKLECAAEEIYQLKESLKNE